MSIETIKVGKRGTIVIPARLRRNYAIEEGSLLNAESCEDGVFLRPVAALSIEMYTPERKAEFLLNSAITREDYIWATKEVSKMGIDKEILANIQITPKADPSLPCPLDLPAKDRPVLMAAISARADYLIAGDLKHFGKYFGQTIEGVKICTARDYLL